MYANKVSICGVDTSKLPIIKEKEIKELLKKSNCGDKSAREKLICGNLRLVLSVVKRFIGRGENPDDLFQIGCIGLIKSIDNFDINQNVRFSTYAVPMVIECRNQERILITMTRKTALQRAISQLSPYIENAEICEKLSDILEDLPLINWTDKSIRDRIEQFYEDEGRYPTTTDFKKKGMPPHSVFKHRYNMTLGVWLKINYPSPENTYNQRKEAHTKAFKEEYLKLHPTSGDDFDRRRQKGTVSWRTLAPYYSVTSWHNLLKALYLPLPEQKQKKRIKQKFEIRVYTDIDFEAMLGPKRRYY